MKTPIPFKCPDHEFSCTVMEDWTIEPNIDCKGCPHKTTHLWTVSEGITPNTDIYTMKNGLRVVHMKSLKRAYVQSENPNMYFSPINTESMSDAEWEQTLLGIEKL